MSAVSGWLRRGKGCEGSSRRSLMESQARSSASSLKLAFDEDDADLETWPCDLADGGQRQPPTPSKSRSSSPLRRVKRADGGVVTPFLRNSSLPAGRAWSPSGRPVEEIELFRRRAGAGRVRTREKGAIWRWLLV
ncbi:hypothetical protein V6Z79_003014 [Aspergillus fumigatus]